MEMAGGFGELGGAQRGMGDEAFKVGVAETEDAGRVCGNGGGRGGNGNVDEEGVAIHLRVLVVNAKDAGEGHAGIDQRRGAVVGRLPIDGIQIREREAGTDPWARA